MTTPAVETITPPVVGSGGSIPPRRFGGLAAEIQPMSDTYQVTVWYKDDETYEVEADSEDEASEKAKEKLEGDTGTWGAEPTNTRVEELRDDGMTVEPNSAPSE